MHVHKRFLALAPVVAVVAASVVPAGASAQDSCVFDGLVGNISPGKMLVGGSGEYEFAGSGRCRLGGRLVPNAEIASAGDFNNIICGTEVAFSRDTATGANHPALAAVDTADDFTTIDDPATLRRDIVNASYHIDFRAGQGTLEIHSVDDTDNGRVDDRAETLSPNGQVTIVPAEGTCTSPTGVTAFTASGAFHWLLVSPAL